MTKVRLQVYEFTVYKVVSRCPFVILSSPLVILSVAKNLIRCFVSLSMTTPRTL